MTLTFIIPSLNEERFISDTIKSIQRNIKNNQYEIILSDNGSKDHTRQIARSLGAIIIKDSKATISQLRNLGVSESTGDILVFLDSDVEITEDWESVLDSFISNSNSLNFITGSKVIPDPNDNRFLIRHWFRILKATSRNYINSGHMIVPRQIHNRISGFDEELQTGEDYDYCARANKLGVQIINNPSLKAKHKGFPVRVRAFIEREAWHGKEDYKSFSRFIKSKTAIAAAVSMTLWLLISLSVLLSEPLIASLFASIQFSILFIIAALKTKPKTPSGYISSAICAQLYLFGRALSPIYKRHRPKARS